MSNVAYADFGNQRRQERPNVADLDNGYTKLANELYEELIGANLTKNQAKVAHAICRKTYGFNKKTDRISDSQLAELTRLPRQKVNKAKNELIAMKVIVKVGMAIGPNKNLTEWDIPDCHQNGVIVTKTVTKSITKSVTALSPKQGHTKETITKEKKEKIPLTPVGENIALEILDYFNQLTNSKFQSTEPILKALNTIKAKGECYTADEIKLVMEWAVKTWTKGKDLKPQNLCRMTRFDGYLSDALKWKNRDGINPVDCPHEELIKIWNRYIPERAIDIQEWTPRRPAYKDLEAVWNGKTNKGQWREVKHMDTCFKLISQSSLFSGLSEKGWLTLDWILTPARWSQTYEQAKREYSERKKEFNMNSKFCDLYAEKSVIGGILNATGEYTDLASSAIETLSEDDFTAVSNKLILRALKRMNQAGAKIDLIMVNSELEQCGDSKNSGGFPYLAECAKDLPSIHMLPGYVEKVKQLSLARRTISILQDGISRINESGVNHVHDIAGQIQEEISNVSNNQVTETQHIMSGVEESLSIIESMISGDIWKYKTEFGLPDIDQAFGGFNNTDFIVIGGRPGMGKTMLSTTITKSVGLAKSKPVLFYSLEMPSWQISERVAFHHARVDKESILGKEKSKMNMDEAWARLSSSLAEIKDSPIYINDKPSMSIHEIRADARRMNKQTGGLGVIIVDYLQKMKMTNPENMNQSVGEIATGLKNLAKELKCPVIALAQLNRNLEQRTNKRPGNADLRESGVIEQEADVIFMIYRDEKYNPNTELKGITEVICTKSRHAPGAEKTYYFTNTHGGLDTADLSRAFMDRYSDADIEC